MNEFNTGIEPTAFLVELDPNDHYEGQVTHEMLGFLPFWVGEWVAYKTNNVADLPTLREHMAIRYGFDDLTRPMGGVISDDHIYKYPGDPGLHPLAVMHTPVGDVFQYPYAIIAFPEPEGYFIVRMD